METTFVTMLNTSLIAGVMVLVVILARFAMRKAPKHLVCLLWGVVAIRLVLPLSVGGLFVSDEPSYPAVSETQSVKGEVAVPDVTEGVTPDAPVVDIVPDVPENNDQPVTPSVPAENIEPVPVPDTPEPTTEGNVLIPNVQVKDPVVEKTPDAPTTEVVKPSGIPARVVGYASVVWVIGMACMSLYAVIGYIRLRLKTRVSTEKGTGVWMCDSISSSFIMGVFRPRIMIPSNISSHEERYILMHERSHLSRLDHIWKPIAYILLTVHWYNPLMWVAFFLFGRDIEYACDERVIRRSGEAVKAPYASALINCAAPSVMSFAGPIAFGEKSVVSRVKNVLSYKKPALWIIIVCVITAVALTVCALLPPVSGDNALIKVEPATNEESNDDGNEVDIKADYVTRYLVEKSERNVISAQYPVFSGDGYEDINLLIRNYLYAKIDDECFGGAELTESDSGGYEYAKDHTAYYADIEYDVTYHTDDKLSIAFSGMFDFYGAAHPNHIFWALNIDPRTATVIKFTDKYTLSEEFYDVFAEYAKKHFVGTTLEDTDFEEICSRDYFVKGIESENGYHFYYTEDGIGISYSVSHPLGDHLEVVIPYDDMEAFATNAVGAEIYAQVIADYWAIQSYRRSEDFERLWNEERYFPEVGKVISDAMKDEELGYRLSCMIVEMDEMEPSFGYKLRDVNGDGVSELFWVNGEGVLLAAFTYRDGEAVLLDAFWPRYSCALTDDGNFYVRGSDGASYTNYEIRRLTAEGYLEVISAFGTDGIDENYEAVYYEVVDGERVTVSEVRFDELFKPFYDIYDSYGHYASPIFVDEDRTNLIFNDGLCHWRIYDSDGKLIEAGKEWRIPDTIDVNDDMVRYTFRGGTGLSTQWGFYFDHVNGRKSEMYYYILDQTDTLVALGGRDKVIVRSIFDDSYYVELTDFEYPLAPQVAADRIFGAKFSEDGKRITVEYITGANYDRVSTVFELPSDDNNVPDEDEKISSERALELLMDGIEQRGVDYPLYCMDSILTTIDGVECYRIQLSSESSEYLYDENGDPYKMSFTYGWFAVDAHTGKLYELTADMERLTEFSYDSEPEPEPTYPSTVFNVSARSDIFDGTDMTLSVTTFTGNKSFFDERMVFINAPVIGAVTEGKTMKMGVSVAASLDELQYNLCETDASNGSSEHLLINSSWLEKYDESYFEENAVIIIVDSAGSGICRHAIIGSAYRDGELSFNLKKRCSEPGVPETGNITRWISIIEIPKTELENVNTISFYVERMEPHTEYMY